jgi:hypothetical protein
MIGDHRRTEKIYVCYITRADQKKHPKTGSKQFFENNAATNTHKNPFGNGLLVYVYQKRAKHVGNSASCFAEQNNGSEKVFACSPATNTSKKVSETVFGCSCNETCTHLLGSGSWMFFYNQLMLHKPT